MDFMGFSWDFMGFSGSFEGFKSFLKGFLADSTPKAQSGCVFSSPKNRGKQKHTKTKPLPL